MRPRILDLNNPADARDYLARLEADGKLAFTNNEFTRNLTDDEVLEAAELVFMKLNGKTIETVQ